MEPIITKLKLISVFIISEKQTNKTRKIDEKPLPVPIPQTQPVTKKPPLLNPLIARFSGASEEEVQVPSAEDYYGSRSGRSCNYRDEMFAGQGSSSSSSVTEFKTYEKVNYF